MEAHLTNINDTGVDGYSNAMFGEKGLTGRVQHTMLTKHIQFEENELRAYVKSKLGPDATIYECNNQPLGSGDLCDAEYDSVFEEDQVSANIVNPGETPPAE